MSLDTFVGAHLFACLFFDLWLEPVIYRTAVRLLYGQKVLDYRSRFTSRGNQMWFAAVLDELLDLLALA